MTSKETVLESIGSTYRGVKCLARRTGLSESTVRRTLKVLIADGLVNEHPCVPALFSNSNTIPS